MGRERYEREPVVYKYVNGDGKIIYVGKTKRLLRLRVREHSMEEKFFDFKDAEVFYTKLNTENEMDLLEKQLIRKYQPELNTVKNWADFSESEFKEPVWEKYVTQKEKHKKQFFEWLLSHKPEIVEYLVKGRC